MKTSLLWVLCTLSLPVLATDIAPTPYSVVKRDANSSVWERKTISHAATGQTVTNTQHYTELATGLNYKDPKGQWTQSKARITLTPKGAEAIEGQHKVYFPADIYNNSLEVVTADGQHLRSRPLFLGYDDGHLTVQIAQLKHSVGSLISSNQMLYADAFTDFKADLLCTYRKSGFECDVIFREQPPKPETFGLDSSASTVQLFTEFYDTADPKPANTLVDWDTGLVDSVLKFGSLMMGHGKAFATSKTGAANANPVYKTWAHLEGRTFLIEELPLPSIANELAALPASSGNEQLTRHIASANRILPPSLEFVPETNQIQVASIDLNKQPGVVLDYVEFDPEYSVYEYVFESGETYYINDVLVTESPTIRGGAIFKFGRYALLIFYTDDGVEDYPVLCETDPQHPAIFTAVDDDTVGARISTSTGYPSGYYAHSDDGFGGITAWNSNAHFHDLRFRYMDRAFCDLEYTTFLRNVEIQDCGYGLYFRTATCIAENCLFDNVEQSIDGEQIYFSGTFITLYNSGWGADYPEISFTNSLIMDLNYVHTNTHWVDMGHHLSVPFISNGVDHCFLNVTNPFRNYGTPNINYELLTNIAQMTTYAPQDGNYPDTNTNAPDMGYHYPINEDYDYDGLPDWWELKYFGNYNQSGTNDFDRDGHDNEYEYEHGIDPNKIMFGLLTANLFVSTNTVPIQIDLQTGVPFYIAVLVNDTNLADAVWEAFSGTNINVSLGSADGVYNVSVGLWSLPTDAKPVWDVDQIRFTLDRVKPRVTITNPILASSSATVIKPYLQLQGYTDKQLASATYDISNAWHMVTNLPVSMQDQVFNTNLFTYTTNYFQAVDVHLTNGANRLTVRVTDLAGNTTTTNFTVTLDYSGATTPPAVALIWPQPGMSLNGSSFTIRGTMSDETGSIIAQVVDSTGATNFYAGIVERNNMFWVEDVGLNGTSQITIRATDAAGNVTTTNFTVTASALEFAITSTPTGSYLYDGMGTVSGTIGDTNYTVTVNGVTASVNASGNGGGTFNWTAQNVPVYGMGTATFDASASANGGGSGGGGGGGDSGDDGGGSSAANANSDPEYPAAIITAHYSLIRDSKDISDSPYPNEDLWTKQLTNSLGRSGNNWVMSGNGIAVEDYWDNNDSEPLLQTLNLMIYAWSPNGDATWHYMYEGGNLVGFTTGTNISGAVKYGPDNYLGLIQYYADHVDYFNVNSLGALSLEWKSTAVTEYKLYTGGKASSGGSHVFHIHCDAAEYFHEQKNYVSAPWNTIGARGVPYNGITILGQTPDTNKDLIISEPDNAEMILGLRALGRQYYGATVSADKDP